MKVSVLVVEDNRALNKSIVTMLSKEDFSAYGCTDISNAKETFLRIKPDIVLLDIMLPGGDGYKLISLFKNHSSVRIIMLTALDDLDSKKICYENGADDYITKPFSLYELLYKLNAVKRWISKEKGEIVIGDLVFTEVDRSLSCGERSIVLQPSQAKLFKSLYNRYIDQQYLDKDNAFNDSEKSIDDGSRIQTLIARLRKNIDYLNSKEVEIDTIYGKGYCFVVTEREKGNEQKEVCF